MLKLRWMLVLALFASLALTSGCDDSTSNNSNSDAPDGRDVPDLGEVDPATSQLVVVNPPDGESLRFSLNSDANIVVRYVNGDGIPIPDRNLSFTIVESADSNGTECHTSGMPCMELSAFTSSTDSAGEATVTVRNRSGAPADATIEVAVEGVDSVMPVFVNAEARAKDQFDLIVEYEYNGGRSFPAVKPALFEVGNPDRGNYMSCADVVAANPPRTQDDINTIGRSVPDVERLSDGSIEPARFIALPTGSQWIAAGWALTESGLITVYGCTDGTPAVTDGQNATITVTLEEIPIEFVEVYKLTSNFDLLSGLPRRANDMESRQAGDWVDLVVGLFQDPGATLFGLLAPVIEDLAGFDIPDGLEPVAAELINDAIAEFAPGWLNNILTVGGDVAELVTSLQLVGEFRIHDQADPETGLIPAGQEHIYNGINIRWRLSCVQNGMSPEDCNGARTGLSFAELGKPDLAINGTWDGAVVDCADGSGKCLVINQHGMTIPYGEIALAVIEGWVLPELFGSQVSSLEDLVDRVLLQFIVDWYNGNNPGDEVTTNGCEAVGEVLANSLADDGFANDILQTVGELACTEGRDFLIDLVRDLAADLNIDTEDNLLLATGGDCQLQDSDEDLKWDLIGENLSEDRRCDWDIKFRWNAGDDPVDLQGKFHAGSQQ